MNAREGFSVFLLGATEEVVSLTASRMQALNPGLKLAGYHHGYFWNDEAGTVEKIRAGGAQWLFVAITSPKKENFINRWRDQLGVSFVMGVGGTFDVVAGKVQRAPLWMQRRGLEWLYRVIQEPRRMWKRYLVTNAKFGGLLVREKVRQVLRGASVGARWAAEALLPGSAPRKGQARRPSGDRFLVGGRAAVLAVHALRQGRSQ